MHRRTLTPVCVLVAVLQIASPALAQPEPAPAPVRVAAPVVRRPVAIVNLDLTGNQEVIDLATDIGRALETHAALRPLGLLAPLYERIDDPDANQLDRARKKEAEALVELANGNFENAARLAKEAQGELWSVTPTQAVALYAELAFVRGKALLGDNKAKEARESFSLSQRLDSTRQIDRAREPPDVVAAYDAARTAPAPLGRIAIDTFLGSEKKATGTVWIDGTEKGFAPNEYVVTSGLHVVWVTDRDRATSGTEIVVTPNGTTIASVPEQSASLTLQLQRTRQELARAPDDGAKIVAMKRLAKISGVKDAVVLSLASGKVVYQTWRSDDADRAPGFSPKHERGPRDQPVKVLEDLVPPPIEEDPPGVVFPIPIDDRHWYQKPSYWAGIAFGASLAAVGAYFVISSLLPDTFGGFDPNVGISNPEDRLTR